MSISQYKVPLTLLFILLLLTKALPKSYTKKIENKKKNECLDGLKEFLPKTVVWVGVYYAPCQERLYKIKYGVERSISIADLGLF